MVLYVCANCVQSRKALYSRLTCYCVAVEFAKVQNRMLCGVQLLIIIISVIINNKKWMRLELNCSEAYPKKLTISERERHLIENKRLKSLTLNRDFY